MSAEPTVRRVEGAEVITELRPLYLTLHEHQAAVAPRLAGMAARTPEDAWTLRSAEYQAWLASPGSFVVLAERGSQLVGYALVTPGGHYQGWESSGQVGDVIDIVVEPSERGHGIGGVLLDETERQLRADSIAYVRLRVLAANVPAIRLYERRGMETVSNILMRRIETSDTS